MNPGPAAGYVSRGGEKLAAALHAFAVDVRGLRCIDFGSHVGGFVDCLLRHGAERVVAVEPGYGVLDHRLRADPRVAVHERTNALTFEAEHPVELITVDVGWTPQRLILPAVRRCLLPAGRVITLIKPHYEAEKRWLRGGVLPCDRIDAVLQQCRCDVRELGWTLAGEIESPLRGHGGNREYLWLLQP